MTVRISTLANGLRVVTDTADHVESASVGMWFGAGARYERPEENGVAHLLEHMVFKGTARRSAQDIAEEIEAVGGSMNAYTSRENTAFYAKVLKDDVALAVDVVADMMTAPAFDPVEMRRERAVVLQEIGQARDTPDDIVFDHFQDAAFPQQSLGRPVLGTESTVGALEPDFLRDFMSRHYGAGNAVLSAAGHIDHDSLVALAEEHLGQMPGRSDSAMEAAAYRGGEARVEEDLEQVHLVLGFPGVPFSHNDLIAQAVFSQALGGGMSSRLFQEIRERRGLVYSIYSMTSSYADTGIFRIYAGTGPAEIAELIPVLCNEVREAADGLTSDEIARAKVQLRAQYLMALESIDQRGEQHALQLLRYGRVIPTEEMVGRIDAVDGAALSRVADNLFSAPPVVAAIGPLDRLETFDSIAGRLAA